jgi:hypothetical protein
MSRIGPDEELELKRLGQQTQIFAVSVGFEVKKCREMVVAMVRMFRFALPSERTRPFWRRVNKRQ